MKFKNVSLVLLIISFFLQAVPARAYYGVNSTEAWLTYKATADVLWKGKPTLQQLNGAGAIHKRGIEAVEEQVQHLMGTFQSPSFIKEFKNHAGVLGEQANYVSEKYKQINFDITFTKVEPGTEKGRIKLSYKFKGKTVFDKRAFKNSDEALVPLKLPLSPDLIYSQSLDTKRGQPFNYCTDEHYNDEGDFWYFWDPQYDNCKLAEDDELVLRIDGKLKMIPNTDEKYPDYNKLYNDNGNKKTLKIAILLGYVDDITNHRSAHRKDTAYQSFLDINKTLKARGFTMLDDKEHKKDSFRMSINGNQSKGANFLREFVSTIKTDTNKEVDVTIQVLLADTSLGSTDNTFRHYLVPAFEKSDVLIYDGHSGLGGNLNLKYLPKIKFNQNKYQIFFFNGCSSYSYYNGMFFDAKGGTKNLDIVNAGLETSSDSSARNVLSFMQYIIQGDLASYEQILKKLEKSNGAENGTYLTGVMGETNNRYKPK